jgi:3-oxoacyl-[acyl-carrier-protein] synthase-3
MSFNIIGTGSAVPETVLTNADLSKFLDTSDEWISTRTGIKERHILNHETMLDLSVKASKEAIINAKIDNKDIDMVICSTVQGDFITPAMSCLISKEINPDCSHVFDINMGCSAKTVSGRGAGAGLLRTPEKIARIFSRLKNIFYIICHKRCI